jgi:hypothetical protein
MTSGSGVPHPLRALIARTDRSAPVLVIGTFASQLSPPRLLPWHPRPGSCSSTRKPASDSRPPYAGRRLPGNQVPGRLVPEEVCASGFDGIECFSTHHRRVCLRSSLGRLPARVIPRAFDPTLTTMPLEHSSLDWFETRSLKADPEGPALIFRAALRHGS